MITADDRTDFGDAGEANFEGLAAATGPVLHLRGWADGHVRLSVILIRPAAEAPILSTSEGTTAPRPIRECHGVRVLRYDFTLPAARDAGYALEGRDYAINTDFNGDTRIAFVSCNGQENGDRDRDTGPRNVMWRSLAACHDAEPLNLILQGGDQIYADEVLQAHPRTREWGRPNGDPGLDAETEVPAIEAALSRELFRRYLELCGQAAPAHVFARVPSLAMWDDHDIADGWGSLPEAKLDSPVGRAVFRVARDHFLLFQMGATDETIPEAVVDREGVSLGWRVALPGLCLIAPDLRSERRPERVMGPAGWQMLEKALDEANEERVLLVSTVPALGPRLSILEAFLHLVPAMQKYEDDLRDQWQSRSHRTEWRRFLRQLLKVHGRGATRLSVLSGEIHLATRGTLASEKGPLHQLVASGITHPPPPKAYAATLGSLARLGESPLRGHPIRLHPLPGHGGIYTAERNYLMLVRSKGRWRAWWELEESGATPALDLG